MISKDRVRPDPAKLSAVENFPIPPNAKNIRQFLGYYHWFIPGFSKITSLLSNLLKKNAIFVWNDATQEAFDTLRKLLYQESVLKYPNFERDFIITIDASNYVVLQRYRA